MNSQQDVVSLSTSRLQSTVWVTRGIPFVCRSPSRACLNARSSVRLRFLTKTSDRWESNRPYLDSLHLVMAVVALREN